MARLNPLFSGFYAFLYQLRPLTQISHLALTPCKGMQYVRSAGSYAKILILNITQHTSLVKLQSGVRKYCSIYSIVLPTASALSIKNKLSNGKSGFWRMRGKKSIVRGVAKNPVDHPHGGRTKAIKYPRTP